MIRSLLTLQSRSALIAGAICLFVSCCWLVSILPARQQPVHRETARQIPQSADRTTRGLDEMNDNVRAAVPEQAAQLPGPASQVGSSHVPPDFGAQNQPMITRADALAGAPFGIGRISFRLSPGDEMVLRTGATMLTERNNRIFYPVLTQSPVRTFFSRLTGNERKEPSNVHTIWFLFKGEQPLELILDGSGVVNQQLEVEYAKPKKFTRFADQWWNEFYASSSRQAEEGDYPGVVESYLTAMLSRRMGLAVPLPDRSRRDPLMQTFELLFDVESLRIDTIYRSMAGMMNVAAERQVPLPPPIEWMPVSIRELPADIEIEPMAECVPEECFYLRFGTWDNQIWLKRLLEEYGGDLSRMIQLRGFQQKIQSKFLDQLAIQSTEFDVLFGGNLIDDVAVIGMDVYSGEGAAIGVMLHAKNTERLDRNLKSKRMKFAAEHEAEGCKIEQIEFEGSTIEAMTTPDNRYRSFYVTARDCHLMTTSLTVAKRFVQAAAGDRSLAGSQEFRFARYQMPLERDDTIFVYVSTRFFQHLLTPRYQIELRRRNQVITEMQMLEIARLAASHEGDPIDLDSLIANGFLPNGFGTHTDNSHFAIDDGATWLDAMRGRRGFFRPVPDVEIATVSAEEAHWYSQRAAFFTNEVGAVDPMVIAIKRYEQESLENVERVIFDARLAPFGEEKYGWLLKRLGPPLQSEVQGSPEDIVSLQASLRATGSLQRRPVDTYQVFAAVQDYFDPQIDLRPTSIFDAIRTLKEVPSYAGAWPAPGYLDMLPALGGQPDEFGYTYSRLLDLWRLEWGEFALVSFDRERLERLKPQLQLIPSERPAHVRFRVGDLANSNLRDWASAVNYRRSWETSIANTRLLNMLTQQFGIQPEITRDVAEQLLNVDLVCSLGGEYQPYALSSGRTVWGSSAWPSFASPQMPPGYSAPFLNWFRGVELEVTKAPSRFSVHGYIDIQRDEETARSKLPSINLFKGFGDLFGGSESDEDERNDKEEND